MDVVENPPAHLSEEDRTKCFYARDYASGMGYSYGDDNSIISNFKKPMSKKDLPEWRYKLKAIEQFSNELYEWLKDIKDTIHVCPMPCSKIKPHSEYDPRVEVAVKRFAERCDNAQYATPIIRAKTMRQAHASGSDRPSIQEIYDSLEWVGFTGSSPELILLVDDVITAGASFKACQRLFNEHVPDVPVWGAFWAKTVWPNKIVEEQTHFI